ncbi:hypothetical protein BG011_002624 [Mortierella polycephala]|uniref:RRM domain-containing protein n=1 Tax=Mortierella polycephala TaxID=41804 RepID=A0A9P6Q2X6_9FUNG|nr:hypothetical protein BG011_002624 [Mortierella polycephala]
MSAKMAVHSVSTTVSSASNSSAASPSSSPTTTSSPTLLSSPSTVTTPTSNCSPSNKDGINTGNNSINRANNISNRNNSIFDDDFDDSTSASARGISILNGSTLQQRYHSISLSQADGISDPFGLSDYFSSSVPKASMSLSNTNGQAPYNHSQNSIHIGSLTNGLSGLSLAAQSLNNNSNGFANHTSSLSSGLYGHNSNNNPVSNGNQSEEISTIFVVGFPDDMQEREFQNMFVFTPGFEAATLKIPHKDQQEDDALTLGVNGVNPRKQIIGFAKFRSHQDALQAINVLSGRRVDAEKGSLLKAEMAKKNLHTRRGLSNELVATPGPSVTAASNPPVSAGSTSIHPVNINAKRTPHPLQHRNSLDRG